MNEKSPGTKSVGFHGQLINERYRIISEIGYGAMGDVFSAHDERLDRDVAIKVLKEMFTSDPVLRERFEREARAAGRLSHHPNIVTVFDVGEAEEGLPFIVMELVNGGTLASRLHTGIVPTEEALGLVRQILHALAFAHLHGVFHRDIKPSNILLTDTNEVKVGDFGIAAIYDGAGDADLTLTSQIIGTPSYLSPERADNIPATASSDVFSVGVILYELLTGTKPFKGGSPLSIIMAAKSGIYDAPELINPYIPPGVSRVIKRALSPSPEARYSSAAHMAAALDLNSTLEATAPIMSSAMADLDAAMGVTSVLGAGAAFAMAEDPYFARTLVGSTVTEQALAAQREITRLSAAVIAGALLLYARASGWLKESFWQRLSTQSKAYLGLALAAFVGFIIVMVAFSGHNGPASNSGPSTSVLPTTTVPSTTLAPTTTTAAAPTTTVAPTTTQPPIVVPPGRKKKGN